MACLHAKDLPPEAFLQDVEAASWPEDAMMMVFSLSSACFERFRGDRDLLMGSDQGRIFSPGGELRWRRMANAFRAVYLGEPPAPADLEDRSEVLEGLEAEARELILWGRATEDGRHWIEQQVPHRFAYPTSGEPYTRVALEVEHWLDADGRSRFARYKRLKTLSGGSHAAG